MTQGISKMEQMNRTFSVIGRWWDDMIGLNENIYRVHRFEWNN